jgi:hypothetical protein
MLSGPTGDRTPAKVSSDADRELQNRRNHNDAFGLVEQDLRNPVGDIHDFLEDLAARCKALLFPAFRRRESGTRQENGDDKNSGFFHGMAPKLSYDSLATIGRRQLAWGTVLS